MQALLLNLESLLAGRQNVENAIAFHLGNTDLILFPEILDVLIELIELCKESITTIPYLSFVRWTQDYPVASCSFPQCVLEVRLEIHTNVVGQLER
jgi:hypothetical protein